MFPGLTSWAILRHPFGTLARARRRGFRPSVRARKGFARLDWPRYAFANLGHPYGFVEELRCLVWMLRREVDSRRNPSIFGWRGE
jgi:hypothetical protein